MDLTNDVEYAQHFKAAALGSRDAKLALIALHHASIDSGHSGPAENMPWIIMWARLLVPHGLLDDEIRLAEYLLYWLGWCDKAGDHATATQVAGEALNWIDRLADQGVDWAEREMPQFADWLWPDAMRVAARFRAIDNAMGNKAH